MLLILVIALGLVFGSFLAASTFRIPRGIAIWDGFSFCDKCKKPIKWYENIPLFSYIFLGGKCSKCRKSISPRYPIIEFITGLSFLFIYKLYGSVDLNLFLLFSFDLILAAIFIIDYEQQIIPDQLVYLGGILALFVVGTTLFASLFSGFIAASFLMMIVGKSAGGVGGDIVVNDPGGTAADLEGIYLADSNFTDNSAATTALAVRGTVVAYEGVILNRSLGSANATTPAETFTMAPDQLMLFPKTLGTRKIIWKEVAP